MLLAGAALLFVALGLYTVELLREGGLTEGEVLEGSPFLPLSLIFALVGLVAMVAGVLLRRRR